MKLCNNEAKNMTGEMIKPKNADRDESYWKDKTGIFGRILGDESFLIKPNYPDFFELRDKIRKIGYRNADVEPFDVYRGPYIDLKGVEVGKQPYNRGGLSLQLSKLIKSCQIWSGEFPGEWILDCGRNNRKLLGSEEPFEGDEDTLLDVLKNIKDKVEQ